MEYISPEGLRQDGRRPQELRQLKCEIGVLTKADGSAIFEMGSTKVGSSSVETPAHVGGTVTTRRSITPPPSLPTCTEPPSSTSLGNPLVKKNNRGCAVKEGTQ
jgi:exosome complex RNA-binding protein Rrp42 (RNase PH superfamily)